MEEDEEEEQEQEQEKEEQQQQLGSCLPAKPQSGPDWFSQLEPDDRNLQERQKNKKNKNLLNVTFDHSKKSEKSSFRAAKFELQQQQQQQNVSVINSRSS